MQTFEEAHPELMDTVNRELGDISKLKKYQNFKGDKITEQWERDKDGNLVNVTERVLAEQELVEAERALKILLEASNG